MNDENEEIGGLDAAMSELFGGDAGQPQPQPQPAPQPAEDDFSGAPLSQFTRDAAPAKPEDPPPRQPLPTDTSDIPDHVVRKGDAAISGWKQLRAELDAAKARAAEIERDREMKDLKLKELEEQLGKVPKEEDLAAARKRAEELEDTLGKIDVTKSKRFQELYDKPIHEVFSKVVRQFMKGGHSEENALAKARQIFRPGMQDPQALSQVLEDESSLVVGAVSALLDEREMLAQRRDEALANWRQEQAAETEDRGRREAATISDQLSKAAQTGFERAAKEGSFLYQSGSDPKWNEGVKARQDAVLGFIRGGKPDELAYLVAEGVASPVYRNAYARVKAENEDLKAQLASISGSRPGMGEQSGPSTMQPSQPAPPESPMAALEQLWRE